MKQTKRGATKTKGTFSKFIIMMILALPTFSLAQSFVWAKSMVGTGGGNDYGRSIAHDAGGNVYTTGNFSGTVDFDPGASVFTLTAAGAAGADDVFISKLDAAGNFVWAKAMGGTSVDVGNSITLDVSGNVYTTGYFAGTSDYDPGVGVSILTSTASFDIFISKLDAAGNFVWAKSMGGVGANDYGKAIAVDATGNVFTTGYFGSTGDFDPNASVSNLISVGTNDIFVSKLDATGNFVWAKSMGGTTADAGNSIALDASGNVYTSGYFKGTADFDPGVSVSNLTSLANDDIFISKLDAAGNFVWAKSIGGTVNDVSNSITLDASGNVLTTGYFSGTVDFDPGVGVVNLASSVAGNLDIFISKLDATGNFVWAKSMGSVSDDIGNGIATDASGNVYTTGFFRATVDFDPGAGTFNLTSLGNDDIFISKLDATGNFVWAKAMGGTNTDNGNSITVDASANVLTTGTFEQTVDFDPDAGVFNLISAFGSRDIFVHKMSQGPLAIKETNFVDNYSIYPNPFNNKITIVSNEISQTIQIFNILGDIIYSSKIENEKTEIDLSNQAIGIYFIRIGTATKKIIKQ